jgi:hypothetical protein
MSANDELKESDIKECWKATSDIYSECCAELGYSRDSIKGDYWSSSISKEEMIKKREELDNLYLKKILELPTRGLELIIRTHNNGIRRTQRTIDAVSLELLSRSLGDNEEG